MATQTGSIDLKAAKKAHDDAEKVATNYVADISNGILVHPDNDNTNGVKITDKVEVIRNSASVAEFGTSARIGENASGKSRTEIGTAGMQIYQNVNGTDTQIANLGYGPGNDEHGATTNAPYYTFGMRESNSAIGNHSVAEGYSTIASGYASHAEGYSTKASGNFSHAEGSATIVSGNFSHVEGSFTQAPNDYAHAEGYQARAFGISSHAEGTNTVASEQAAHAEGLETTASGKYTHAGGYYTIAQRKSQTAIGEYNIADTTGADGTVRGDYAVIIGNGTADNARSNALTVDWDGNVQMALDTTAASGTDHDLYAAINALGWASDVIV